MMNKEFLFCLASAEFVGLATPVASICV